MQTPARGWTFFTAFAGAVTGAVLGGGIMRPPPARVDPGAAASAASAAPPSGAGAQLAAPTASPGSACPPLALAPATQSALAVEIASRVRAALDAPRAPEPDAPATPEALAARSDAEELLDRALSARAWTEQDAVALRPLLPHLAGSDLDALMLALSRALNEGQLALLTEGPPF